MTRNRRRSSARSWSTRKTGGQLRRKGLRPLSAFLGMCGWTTRETASAPDTATAATGSARCAADAETIAAVRDARPCESVLRTPDTRPHRDEIARGEGYPRPEFGGPIALTIARGWGTGHSSRARTGGVTRRSAPTPRCGDHGNVACASDDLIFRADLHVRAHRRRGAPQPDRRLKESGGWRDCLQAR